MPQITVRFDPSLSELARKFSNIDVQGFLQKEIQELAFLIEAESKKVSPVKTGRMRASIRTMPVMRPLQQVVQPNVDYAIFVHEGTRYMRGRPFMWWGAQSASAGLDKKVAKDLDALVERSIR